MGGSAVAAAADACSRAAPGVARFASEQVFASGAYVATVEVERATGAVRVLRLVAVDDAGTIVNPLLAEGQVFGGAVQGLGAVLTEEVVHDEHGQPVNRSLLDYTLLTAVEIPEFSTALVESPSPFNPLGLKGIGEAGNDRRPRRHRERPGGRARRPPHRPSFHAEKLWRALQ